MLALFVGHIPEGAGDLQRFRIVELGKHLSKLVIDLGVALLDENGYVQCFLRRKRGEVAFHCVAPRWTTFVVLSIPVYGRFLYAHEVTGGRNSRIGPAGNPGAG